jgi:hypothetical protein
MSDKTEIRNCRKDAQSIQNHNKSIFHLKQCQYCFSGETIEPDKERRVLAGQAMMGIMASPEAPVSDYEGMAIKALKAADALIAELEKTEK